MRFHVISLAHTQTTSDYPSCAFTQKVIRFCQMMHKQLGHEVFLYSGEENEAPCTEHISCIPKNFQEEIIQDTPNRNYTEASWMHPHTKIFNAFVVAYLTKRLQPQDFICVIGGGAHAEIARNFPNHLVVEFGIGYSATFAKYRVFESYAWMHAVNGANRGIDNLHNMEGRWFDTVIPNQIDPDLFELGAEPQKAEDKYFLYLGRLIELKGYKIAQDVCEQLGYKLILAGLGEQVGYGEFVGEVSPDERRILLSGAQGLFVPTIYTEPFGTVAIEAFASGTPVISTDWGAFTETVRNGINGFRCRMYAEFLASAELLWSNWNYMDRAAIRTAAIQKYGMATVALQYEKYFKQLNTLWGDGWNTGKKKGPVIG